MGLPRRYRDFATIALQEKRPSVTDRFVPTAQSQQKPPMGPSSAMLGSKDFRRRAHVRALMTSVGEIKVHAAVVAGAQILLMCPTCGHAHLQGTK
jgi:rubrerythrin